MRIAFVTYEYPPIINGGAGIYAENITNELANLGHEVVVFTPRINNLEKSNYANPNLKIVYVTVNNLIPFKAIQFWFKLPYYIKKMNIEKKFDIIHFNGLSYWFIKKRLVKAPHIVTIHHLIKDVSDKNNRFIHILNIKNENNFILRIIEKICIKSVDKIIAVSNFTQSQIIHLYNINPSKVHVIYNGNNITKINLSCDEILVTKKKLSITNAPIILFVGRVDDLRKGLDILLNSLPLVIKEYDVNLLIIGKGNTDHAMHIAEELDILDHVHFAGFVDELTLKKLYSISDIYVCPSRMEGFGLTIAEAMSVGLPIIASNVGAIPEILDSYSRGILFEPENINGLHYSICHILKNIASYKKGNDNDIYNKYKWLMSAKEVEKIYKNEIGASDGELN